MATPADEAESHMSYNPGMHRSWKVQPIKPKNLGYHQTYYTSTFQKRSAEARNWELEVHLAHGI